MSSGSLTAKESTAFADGCFSSKISLGGAFVDMNLTSFLLVGGEAQGCLCSLFSHHFGRGYSSLFLCFEILYGAMRELFLDGVVFMNKLVIITFCPCLQTAM